MKCHPLAISKIWCRKDGLHHMEREGAPLLGSRASHRWFFASFLLGAILCICQTANAEGVRPLSIRGKNEVVVTTESFRLGDVADIEGRNATYDSAVIALQKIEIGRSPEPGKDISLSAVRIIELLKANRVDLASVGYALPRTMIVRRASRLLREDEARLAIEEALGKLGKDITLREVELPLATHVFPETVTVKASLLNESSQGYGRLHFHLKVIGRDGESLEIPLSVRVDEFRALPVARRPLPRGSVVSPEDVVMARLNVSALSKAATQELSSVVGYETSRAIASGEAFSGSDLKVPPVVTVGSVVTMLYKTPLFEATASGVALDAGTEGQEVRIRNDQSRKIVKGKVLGPGIVGVNP